MALYRLAEADRRLVPFRPIPLQTYYQEKDIEDWFEQSPEVLVGDEPLLVIGRQVNTPVGIIDLLALDSSGAGVIIELKRAPDQRGAIAQALEYASWLSTLAVEDLYQVAARYLAGRGMATSLEAAWRETFSADLEAIDLNARQRVFIVIEGQDERLASVARFLRVQGVEIALLAYQLYHSDAGEEMLLIEALVGDDGVSDDEERPSEARVLARWPADAVSAYRVLSEVFVSRGLYVRPKKSGVSFHMRSVSGETFVCFVDVGNEQPHIWIRADSMQSVIDFDAAAAAIRADAPIGSSINHARVWYIVRFPASEDAARQVAGLVLREIVERLADVGTVS